MNENYTVVSICNRRPEQNYYCLVEWEKSLQDTNTIVIQAIDTPYTGLGDKPKFLYRAIKKGLITTDYIIFCDCWDLVFTTSPEEVIEKFLQFNCDIVISAEKNCFPDTLKDEYDKLPSTSSYKYLNSGFIVGKTEAIKFMLEDMKVEEIPYDYWDAEKGHNVHFNDQFEVQKYYIKNVDLQNGGEPSVIIKLDQNQILSQTMHQVTLDELDFSKPRIKNKETNSYPCTIHFNGESKTSGVRIPILKHLNLI